MKNNSIICSEHFRAHFSVFTRVSSQLAMSKRRTQTLAFLSRSAIRSFAIVSCSVVPRTVPQNSFQDKVFVLATS